MNKGEFAGEGGQFNGNEYEFESVPGNMTAYRGSTGGFGNYHEPSTPNGSGGGRSNGWNGGALGTPGQGYEGGNGTGGGGRAGGKGADQNGFGVSERIQILLDLSSGTQEVAREHMVQ